MTRTNCFHRSIQIKGRSDDFSPFDMQLMIDDGDLMEDDPQMMRDDGNMFIDD